MSYPDPKYFDENGEVSAVLRTADQPHDIEMSKNGTQVHYLATGASTNGEFALYRWNFSGRRSGPDPHFHKTVSESFFAALAEWATTGREPAAEERTTFMTQHDNYFI